MVRLFEFVMGTNPALVGTVAREVVTLVGARFPAQRESLIATMEDLLEPRLPPAGAIGLTLLLLADAAHAPFMGNLHTRLLGCPPEEWEGIMEGLAATTSAFRIEEEVTVLAAPPAARRLVTLYHLTAAVQLLLATRGAYERDPPSAARRARAAAGPLGGHGAPLVVV